MLSFFLKASLQKNYSRAFQYLLAAVVVEQEKVGIKEKSSRQKGSSRSLFSVIHYSLKVREREEYGINGQVKQGVIFFLLCFPLPSCNDVLLCWIKTRPCGERWHFICSVALVCKLFFFPYFFSTFCSTHAFFTSKHERVQGKPPKYYDFSFKTVELCVCLLSFFDG